MISSRHTPWAKFEVGVVWVEHATPLIPYSRKNWLELNLAVEPKIAIARILADLNLAVRYGIAIRIIIIIIM